MQRRKIIIWLFERDEANLPKSWKILKRIHIFRVSALFIRVLESDVQQQSFGNPKPAWIAVSMHFCGLEGGSF